MSRHLNIHTLGLLGFGAFGRLVATHLSGHFRVVASDPDPAARIDTPAGVVFDTPQAVARCDLVILAVPVAHLAGAIDTIAPHLRPGAIVVDVGSVKVAPIRLMLERLPDHVGIVGTHPLFGPQSAADGIEGRKITLCPARGKSAWRIGAFLRRKLDLRVCLATAEEHDRQCAVVQGLTHLIARVLVQMEPLPRRLTTASFEHLMRAVDMVRHDSAGVFDTIGRENPFAAEVRDRFFAIAEDTRRQLEGKT